MTLYVVSGVYALRCVQIGVSTTALRIIKERIDVTCYNIHVVGLGKICRGAVR